MASVTQITHTFSGPSATVTVSPITQCVPGSDQVEKGFDACVSFFSYDAFCTDADCLCHQTVLDSIYGCGNEMLNCYHTNMSFDNSISSWSAYCLPQSLTFTPTTHPLSHHTTTTVDPNPTPSSFSYNYEYCKTVQTACILGDVMLEACDPVFALPQEYSSCWCETELQLAYYTCLYLGDQRCRTGRDDAVLGTTDLPGYKMCSDFEDVVGVAAADATATPATTDGADEESTPLTPTPTTTTPAEETGPTPTTTPVGGDGEDIDSGGQAAYRGRHSWWETAILLGAVFAFL